jgi:hypothetical protein
MLLAHAAEDCAHPAPILTELLPESSDAGWYGLQAREQGLKNPNAGAGRGIGTVDRSEL